MLIKQGASLDLRNQHGKRAADIAEAKLLKLIKEVVRNLPLVTIDEKVNTLTKDMTEMKQAILQLTEIMSALTEKVMRSSAAPSLPPLRFSPVIEKREVSQVEKKRSLSPSR